jgi:carboxyl-terminal processing protease
MTVVQHRRFPRSILSLAVILVATITFGGGFFLGESHGVRSVVPQGEGRVSGQGEVPDYLSESVDFKQFWNIWNLVKEEYYRQPVSEKQLYYGALKGMVAGTGDPYTVYLDPVDAEEFAANLEGSFEGIGAEIGIKDERMQVVAPVDGAPAARAGLMPGDWIVLIDGTETMGMSVEEAVMLIRGESGTQVTLTIGRDGASELEEVKITREKIVIDSVKWKTGGNNIMEISISTFNHDTTALFNEAMQEALATGVDGIVLDLRNNPGGLLSTAVEIASAWVGIGPVVIERAQENAKTYRGVTASRLDGIPTVVLVNGGSASASEIVSGALQDYGYAKIVGTQTYGKGSVQDYRNLDDGSAVKITIAEWFTPKGRSIHETGIAPDYIVDFSVEQYKAGEDPQLDAAFDILQGTYEAQTES